MNKQPNAWSCTVTALSYLLKAEVESLIKEIGHDGSMIWRPEKKDPLSRRGFHIQELLDVALNHYYLLTEVTPLAHFDDDDPNVYPVFSSSFAEYRLKKYMSTFNGLVAGMHSLNRPHMVAWVHDKALGDKILDPMDGKSYDLKDYPFTIESFYCLTILP